VVDVRVTEGAVAPYAISIGVSMLAAGLLTAPAAGAGPEHCNDAFCTPGITPGVVLGSNCDNTTYYVFGTAVAGPSINEGRLVFCGSPRRYEPRWFRSPPMLGIRDLGSKCLGNQNSVAQAPDGLFLFCQTIDGNTIWVRGDT
jgi:hypothetical protein